MTISYLTQEFTMVVEALAGTAFRFSRITDVDHAGYLWIFSILATVYGCMTGLVRWHIKKGMFGMDDAIFALALVILLSPTYVPESALCPLVGTNTIFTSIRYSYRPTQL